MRRLICKRICDCECLLEMYLFEMMLVAQMKVALEYLCSLFVLVGPTTQVLLVIILITRLDSQLSYGLTSEDSDINTHSVTQQ